MAAHRSARTRIFCAFVWLLGILLIIATLDKIPDPAATSPQAQSLSVHEHPFDSAVSRVLITAPPAIPQRFERLASRDFPPVRQTVVLIDCATDPSPPFA